MSKLDRPHAAAIVRRLDPELLHRVIQTCGLEDCVDLVALATPAQLQRVFDLDLWRAPRPSMDEQLDPDRFGVWLHVLFEAGAKVAAEKLIGMDAAFVVAALAQHVRVFDRAAVSRAGAEIGGYLVEPRRTDAWDPILEILVFLDVEHPDFFHRLMRGCRRLSSSGFEIDGLHDLLGDEEQTMFDLAVDREARREQQGYVTPAQARAFLQSARQLPRGQGRTPRESPIARAYFRSIVPPVPPAGIRAAPASDETAALVDVLREAGVLPAQPRALLAGGRGEGPRLARLHGLLQVAGDADPDACATRLGELAYLANSVAAGCSIQGRPFTPREASDAVAAACNLGLENWPAAWTPITDAFLVHNGLVAVFQIGWAVLYERVCMRSAERLLDTLAALRIDDEAIQDGLDDLRLAMTREWRAGTPWRARGALDVIMMLDQPAWAALLGLIDECPVLHAVIAAARGPARSVEVSAFQFIADNAQLAAIDAYMRDLPDRLVRS